MHSSNAGSFKLYIVHLFDRFAVIALQHNPGTSHGVPQVSALHYPVKSGSGSHTNGKRWKGRQLAVAYMHKLTDGGVVVFIKERWLCVLPWLCSFSHSAEWRRGPSSPLLLGSPVGDEGRFNVKYNNPPRLAFSDYSHLFSFRLSSLWGRTRHTVHNHY